LLLEETAERRTLVEPDRAEPGSDSEHAPSEEPVDDEDEPRQEEGPELDPALLRLGH
jgi:hypothetical protein